MTTIVLIGATGLIGAKLLTEAASRRHHVVAVSRDTAAIAPSEFVAPTPCDLFDRQRLGAAMRGADVVIHAYSPRRDHVSNREAPHRAATRAIIEATRAAGIARLAAVGGAGTLTLPDGTRVMDSPTFPPEWLDSARSTAEVLKLLEQERDLDWTFLCPSLFFDERGRTGIFRLGGDQALIDADGTSRISIEDYAVAMIDEIERPQHVRRRFTVGY